MSDFMVAGGTDMEFTKYLFCYFTGNKPEEERVHFAVLMTVTTSLVLIQVNL